MNSKQFFLFLLALCFGSCNGQNPYANTITDATPMTINRFDKALYNLIVSDDTTQRAQLLSQYPQMTDLIGKAVLNMQSPEVPSFFPKLENFYSEPTLNRLYADAINKYNDVTALEQTLGNAFAWIKEQFPAMQQPAFYLHVSGFSQNILVADGLLSVSIDKYMGADYPLYQNFFYDYQLRKMQPAAVAPDCVAGWLMSEYPFEGKENVLLERMIYEGKMKYLVTSALPAISLAELFGYTAEEWQWCEENEANIWREIIERKHLYTPDLQATSKYFDDAPSQFLADGAPGNIGTWIGLRIIQKYIAETKTTPQQLMSLTDAQELLTLSQYKP